jgi:hypothetical protein
MKCIKIGTSLLLWFVLYGTVTNAEISSNTFYKDPSYKELLNTKNITALELSPDKRHLLLIYTAPHISESKEGSGSQWRSVTLVKNNHNSEKSHTVKFPDDRRFDIVTWIPDS